MHSRVDVIDGRVVFDLCINEKQRFIFDQIATAKLRKWEH